ncbi:MAG: hypothetical protein FWE03_06310 [Firmicutes bacterium]|nr:hypothetical protein [Bacillota bacterium]
MKKVVKSLFLVIIAFALFSGFFSIGKTAIAADNTSQQEVWPNILVTHQGSDNIGSVLTSMDIPWTLLPYNYDRETILEYIKTYDILFINCGTSIEGALIKAFVEQGGLVYASDHALTSIHNAFPKRTDLEFIKLNRQTTTGYIVDEGLRLSADIGYEIEINFDLSDWYLVISPLEDDVTVHIEGAVSQKDGIFPFTFSFPYGNNNGRVFYTSFHQSANNTDDMQEILKTLVLRISRNNNITHMQNWAATSGYDVFIPIFGILDAEQTSSSFTFEIEGNDFAIMNDTSMGSFSITLTAPNGNIYTNFKDGQFVYGVASNKTEQLSVKQLNYLYDYDTNSNNETIVYSFRALGLTVSNPYTYDNLWSFTITSHSEYRNSFVAGIGISTQGSGGRLDRLGSGGGAGPNNNNGFSVWLLILLITGGIAIVAATIVFVIIKRRKSA